jgi:hypothetical protein
LPEHIHFNYIHRKSFGHLRRHIGRVSGLMSTVYPNDPIDLSSGNKRAVSSNPDDGAGIVTISDLQVPP